MSRRPIQKFRKNRGRNAEENSKWLWKSCKSKSRFSEFDAYARAREHGQRAYLCNICNAWHLTSDKGKK